MPVNNPFLSPKLNELTLHSPAKINLMLSVHGRRDDGFHGLTSVVVALAFGDTLSVSLSVGADSLTCSDSSLSLGPDNLVLRAAAAFRQASGKDQVFAFDLDKRIPVGAGLGGGSGNAVAALKGMNQLCGEPLGSEELSKVAATLGSDCPFFLNQQPAVMSGRGEHIDPLPEAMIDQLAGTRLLLFKPDFAVETKWAYGRLLEAAPESYEPLAQAQSRLQCFQNGGSLPALLYNSFERAVAGKYIALAALLAELQAEGVPCLMSGSGSCCFALQSSSGLNFTEIERHVRSAWGETVFFVETSILAGETTAECRSRL